MEKEWSYALKADAAQRGAAFLLWADVKELEKLGQVEPGLQPRVEVEAGAGLAGRSPPDPSLHRCWW